VLPFTKRQNRHEEIETIDSGEIEIVRVAPSQPPASLAMSQPPPKSSRYPAPPSDRPRVFEHNHTDDEMTNVMPSKKGSSFPPASSQAPRSAGRSRASSYAPPRLGSSEDETMLRGSTTRLPPPSSRPASASTRHAPVSSFVPPPPPAVPRAFDVTPATSMGMQLPSDLRAQAIAAMQQHQAQMPFARTAAASMQPAAAMPMPAASGTIPPVERTDPPGTVITTRTRVLIGRPTVSWAAALVAMGVFVGLVTAVVARGDADSLIDATASFVDPAHSNEKTAASQPEEPPGVMQPVLVPAPLPVAQAPLQPAPIQPPAPIQAPAPIAPLAPIQPPVAANPAPVPAPLPPVRLIDAPPVPRTVAATDLPIAAPAPPERKAPVAYAAPAPRPRVYVAPRPRPAPEPPEPKVAAAPKPAPAPKGAAKKGGGGEDDAAAAQAAKLAQEQLEAALK
jgi:hypothetical protein